MRRLLFLAGLFIAAPAQAQDSMILAPGTLAETYCIGGRTTSVINMEILGTDSLAEIAAHEAIHRVQITRRTPAIGGCPAPLKPWELLADEIEAYCAVRIIRMDRGYTKEAVDSNYISRLVNQLGRVMPKPEIAATYLKSCP